MLWKKKKGKSEQKEFRHNLMRSPSQACLLKKRK